MSKRYKIEEMGEFMGYTYSVVFQKGGWRCGYVALPVGHPWITDNPFDLKVDVHGGITYGKQNKNQCYPISLENNAYWIGWDYNHYQDAVSPSTVREYFGDKEYEVCIAFSNLLLDGGHHYNQTEVKEDCLEVIKQAAAVAIIS